MSIKVGIGFSRNRKIEDAAKEAAVEANSALNSRVDLVIVFSTIDYPPERTVPVIRSVLSPIKLLGGSTAGIILSDSVETQGLAVLAVHSDDIKIGIGNVDGVNEKNVYDSGVILARRCISSFGKYSRKTIALFVDGSLKNNTPLITGIQDILGNVFPVVGGASSDAFRFSSTFQIFQDKIYSHSALGLLIGGSMDMGIGTGHGWRPLGKPRIIDEAKGNIIKKINGKMAVDLYKQYLGDESSLLHASNLSQMAILYPLGILVGDKNEYLLRNAVDILADGSIVCQGDVPEGAEVHIMIGNKESCKHASLEAAEQARRALAGKSPGLLIIFESMARLKLLGRAAYQEVELVKSVFGSDVPIIGMYSNGEFCPFESVGEFKRPSFQNESIVVAAIA